MNSDHPLHEGHEQCLDEQAMMAALAEALPPQPNCVPADQPEDDPSVQHEGVYE